MGLHELHPVAAVEPSPHERTGRSPATPAAFAFGGGIVLDRCIGLPFSMWLLAASGALAVAVWKRNAGLSGALCVLLFWVALGGARHHLQWSVRSDDSIFAWLQEEPTPVRLRARLAAPVTIAPPPDDSMTPDWMRIDRSVAVIECRQILGPDGATPASGRLRLEVKGHLLGPQVGDSLELCGLMSRPGPPLNPGGFDYRAWLRARGIDGVLRIDHPDHVTLQQELPSAIERLARWRANLRRECAGILTGCLQPEHVPLGQSLLLGDRSGLHESLRDDFVNSGTMHILAISGLHVAILAGLVEVVCRLLKLRPAARTTVLLTVVLGYAALTDQQPPVLRAAAMAAVVLAGVSLGRQTRGYQSLSLCALLLLLWNPTDLFDIGAQLSFLAVLAIVWAAGLRGRSRVTRESLEERSGWRLWGHRLRDGVVEAYAVTGAVWLFTLPIALWRFNLVAPVGLLINVVLLPLVVVKLAAGYLTLLLGLASPTLATLPGAVFDDSLALMMGLIRGSAATPFGHLSAPAPPGWWLVGFYALLGTACRLVPLANGRVAWRALGIWTIAGLAYGLVPASTDGLRCTFLSVGHGGAVLIELPDGRTLLYDAGSFADSRRAQDAIQNALWASGRVRIDAALISHADVDHFNALPGLVNSVPVGAVMASPSFLDFEQLQVTEACDAVATQGIPIRLLQAGDRLDCGPGVVVEALHPPATFRSEFDNANSLLLRIAYAGRTILLTGDLERDGLQRCLGLPMAPVDVLLSPHHGSLAANPRELGEWARPSTVIVSAGRDLDLAALRERYGEQTESLHTADVGAVACQISAEGELNVNVFRSTEGQ